MIYPGQVYKSIQPDHLGWLVEVTKVMENSLEVLVQTPSNISGNREHFHKNIFTRDYELVRDVTHPDTVQTLSNKKCAQCQTLKSIDEFSPVFIKTGKNKGQQTGHVKNCKTCVNKNMARAARARHGPIPSTSQVEIVVPITQETRESLSQAVLSLATQIEELENFAKDKAKYISLVEICSTIYQTADETHGVYVIPLELFAKFTEILDTLR